jgi:hypothetical protein
VPRRSSKRSPKAPESSSGSLQLRTKLIPGCVRVLRGKGARSDAQDHKRAVVLDLEISSGCRRIACFQWIGCEGALLLQ